MSTATVLCVRPMPMTGTQNRAYLRKKDPVRCQCGQSTCRDYDLKGEQHGEDEG